MFRLQHDKAVYNSSKAMHRPTSSTRSSTLCLHNYVTAFRSVILIHQICQLTIKRGDIRSDLSFLFGVADVAAIPGYLFISAIYGCIAGAYSVTEGTEVYIVAYNQVRVTIIEW